MDYLDLETVPVGEECEQLGPNYEPAKAQLEAKTFIKQLIRQFGKPPVGVRFSVASNPHDFGTYLSVRIHYDTNEEKAIEYAFNVEAHLPESWDDEAKTQLEGK